MTERELVDLAMKMMERAYVPYSHFPVGSALLCADGTVFTGCNVENAAFGSTICAERVSVVKAVSWGHRDDWTALAVAGGGESYCWPCGACRQMLYEFCPDLTILVARGDGEYTTVTLSDLLPHGFGPWSLGAKGGARPAESQQPPQEERRPVEEEGRPAGGSVSSSWKGYDPAADPDLREFAKFFEDDWYPGG